MIFKCHFHLKAGASSCLTWHHAVEGNGALADEVLANGVMIPHKETHKGQLRHVDCKHQSLLPHWVEPFRRPPQKVDKVGLEGEDRQEVGKGESRGKTEANNWRGGGEKECEQIISHTDWGKREWMTKLESQLSSHQLFSVCVCPDCACLYQRWAHQL